MIHKTKTMRRGFNERKFGGFLLIGLAAIALFTLVVMGLWNAILVPVLHVGAVTFWQAAGILLLSKILFGGFRGGPPWRGRGRHAWGRELSQKWENMTPEEREKMKEQWQQRCNRWRSGWQNPSKANREESQEEFGQ
jgi:hypothetical protein